MKKIKQKSPTWLSWLALIVSWDDDNSTLQNIYAPQPSSVLAVDIHLDLEVDRAAAQAGLVDHNLAGLAGLEAVPAEIAAAAVDSPAAAVDSPVAAVDIHLASKKIPRKN